MQSLQSQDLLEGGRKSHQVTSAFSHNLFVFFWLPASVSTRSRAPRYRIACIETRTSSAGAKTRTLQLSLEHLSILVRHHLSRNKYRLLAAKHFEWRRKVTGAKVIQSESWWSRIYSCDASWRWGKIAWARPKSIVLRRGSSSGTSRWWGNSRSHPLCLNQSF